MFRGCLIILIFLSSCSMRYSFNGGSVPNDANTFSVDFFENNATLGPADMGTKFSELLRSEFQSQTKLNLTSEGGDVHFAGEITNYVVQPIAIQPGQTAAQNRLTITVKVVYTCKVEEKKDYEQSFTRFADFDSSQDISAVENQLVDEIFDLIFQDVYNKTFGDW